MCMIDFASSLYLGMKHCSSELMSWKQLTTGAPALVSEFTKSKIVGELIAEMQGLEMGFAAPSTLHLYWDLYGFISSKNIAVFIDDQVYPVSKCGIERLVIKKIPIYSFKHLEADHLADLIQTRLEKNRVPIVLTDGWYPQSGRPAPIKDYCKIISDFNGKVIIDDTQAFGIFGKRTDNFIYGQGGGGILEWSGADDQNIITIVSLSKAFGVPMAVISGNQMFILSFKNASETRESSSAVSSAHLNAATRALEINSLEGDKRRKKLWHNLAFIRNELKQSSIYLSGGIFPVQNVEGLTIAQASVLRDKLRNERLKTVLTKRSNNLQAALTFIIRSDQTPDNINMLINALLQHHPHSELTMPSDFKKRT